MTPHSLASARITPELLQASAKTPPAVSAEVATETAVDTRGKDERYVSEEERQAILERFLKSETTEDLERKNKFSSARWKIQIWIKTGRSIHKPLGFSLSVWESGKRLHGGGDESTFFCRARIEESAPVGRPIGVVSKTQGRHKVEATSRGCGRVIPGELVTGGRAVCPHCGAEWNAEHLSDFIYYATPVENAAVIIANRFRELDSDCDIYVKFRDRDIRTMTQVRLYGIEVARRLKGLTIYPLRNIIKETANGATLEGRIKYLLLS